MFSLKPYMKNPTLKDQSVINEVSQEVRFHYKCTFMLDNIKNSNDGKLLRIKDHVQTCRNFLYNNIEHLGVYNSYI